ncbi:hypothetical protein FIV00_15560 [Labrenzia sp. THAF82]|uniref:TniQ family protein n=1 Tax=Labrenzia sp. THAF82 TaxID=2587861 RepID=UPI001267FC92|nr:TniQ family protein [Labrenzia sp. THAF82]QFT31910.1 hypothetical protein FIV00_15560 [Labrenzia sp. THAF82]
MELDPIYIPCIYPDETVASYVSRVASKAGYTARDFCLDMKLSFQALCDGKPETLARFSKLVGFESDRFPAAIFKRTGDRRFEFKQEPFSRHSLRRATVRVCPHCIQEDLERDVDHKTVRPYGRWSWNIGSIRTCLKHNTPLVMAANEHHPQKVHDFSRLLQPFVEDINRHVLAAQYREPSSLEIYLEKRINGDQPENLLSSLHAHAYAAARACEIIGATKLYGAIIVAESLSEDQWYEAGQVGFDIAIQGVDGIRDYLDHLHHKFSSTSQNWSPRQIYGRLYEWLAHETDDTAYDNLRKIITEHAFETLPMGPNDEIFGRRPAKRIVHSIRSAHQETGAHPKRLKKILHAVGLIDQSQLGQTDERIFFNADDAKFYLDRVEQSMSMNQVRAYINAPRPVDRVLFEAGILKPWLIGGTDIFKDHAFAKCDLDEFLLNLAAGAKPVTNDEIHLVPILKAQKLANCSTLKVVQLILERRVRTLRTDPKETGFLSILVDPEEVKSLVRGKDHAGYSLRQVEKKLKTSTNVVKALVELGYLEAETAINPVKRCRQTIVKREILDAFMNKFETASSLSRRLGIHLQTLMKHLRCSGVEPEFAVEDVHATIYDREIASKKAQELSKHEQ